MRVVVAPDGFKGTLAADRVARAMAEGARSVAGVGEVDAVPLSDGGLGFADRLREAIGGRTVDLIGTNALDETVAGVSVAWLEDGSVAFDAATVCHLPERQQSAASALGATSFGVGEIIAGVLQDPDPIASIVIGIGDTSTTDGGSGAAKALGWRFLDDAGAELPPGGGALVRLGRIEPPARNILEGVHVIAACDVDSPLHGDTGSARRFAPHKGAGPEEVMILERGLLRLDEVLRRDVGIAVGRLAGGGAGGGLAAGLVAFCAATLRSGFEVVADAVGLDALLARADVVVTGEGAFDPSSHTGKVTGEVVRRCRALGIPCAVVAGRVERPLESERHVLTVVLAAAVEDPGTAVADATARALQRLIG